MNNNYATVSSCTHFQQKKHGIKLCIDLLYTKYIYIEYTNKQKSKNNKFRYKSATIFI